MADEYERAGAELRGVSESFVLGLLKAALPAYRIDLSKLKLVLRLAVALGYDPVLLYRKALEGRPEEWEEPPLAGAVVDASVEAARPVQSLEEVKKAVEKVRGEGSPSEPSPAGTS